MPLRSNTERTILEMVLLPSRTAAQTVIELARKVAPGCFSIPRAALDPHQTLLEAYRDYLRGVRGLEPKTCEGLLLAARRVLTWYHTRVPRQPLAAMAGDDVLALIEHLLAASSNNSTRPAVTSYLRTFLQFLQWSDRSSRNLARFVDRANRRTVHQEHTLTVALRPAIKNIIGKRFASFVQQRHDTVAFGLGATHEHGGLAPMDILKLKRAQLLVAQAVVASESMMARSRGPNGVTVSIASMVRLASSQASRSGR